MICDPHPPHPTPARPQAISCSQSGRDAPTLQWGEASQFDTAPALPRRPCRRQQLAQLQTRHHGNSTRIHTYRDVQYTAYVPWWLACSSLAKAATSMDTASPHRCISLVVSILQAKGRAELEDGERERGPSTAALKQRGACRFSHETSPLELFLSSDEGLRSEREGRF